MRPTTTRPVTTSLRELAATQTPSPNAHGQPDRRLRITIAHCKRREHALAALVMQAMAEPARNGLSIIRSLAARPTTRNKRLIESAVLTARNTQMRPKAVGLRALAWLSVHSPSITPDPGHRRLSLAFWSLKCLSLI